MTTTRVPRSSTVSSGKTHRTQSAAAKTVVWITPPNTTIYDPLYTAFGAAARAAGYRLDLVMYLPQEAQRMPIAARGFRTRYFATRDRSRAILFPIILANRLRGLSNHDELGNGMVAFLGLEEALAKDKPSLVIINAEYNTYAIQAARWCAAQGIPHIVQTETKRMDSRFKRLALKAFLRVYGSLLFTKAAAVLPWTEASVRFVRETYPVAADRVHLVPAGVDPTYFRMLTLRPRPRETVRLLVVSRLVPYKRIPDLFAALSKLEQTHPSLRVVVTIVGDGPLRSTLQAEVDKRGLRDRVTFAGRIPRRGLVRVYNQHDALVLTSYNEAIGMVVPEAMACGTPVIVSDTSGATQYVSRGTGYVYATGSVAALADCIVRLARADRKNMRLAARRAIVAHWSVARAAQLWARVVLPLFRR